MSIKPDVHIYMYYIYILSGKDRKDRFENNCQALRLIHTYPATGSGRSESGPFVIENYFL